MLLLLDADYLNLYRERKAKVYGSSPDSQSIDRLTTLIEGPAEAAEEEIWAELKAGRRSKVQFKNNHREAGAGDSDPEPRTCGVVTASDSI